MSLREFWARGEKAHSLPTQHILRAQSQNNNEDKSRTPRHATARHDTVTQALGDVASEHRREQNAGASNRVLQRRSRPWGTPGKGVKSSEGSYYPSAHWSVWDAKLIATRAGGMGSG